MWTWLASLIGGPVVNGLINAYKAKVDGANTQDRIVADLAAKEIEAEIEARKQACESVRSRDPIEITERPSPIRRGVQEGSI